MRKYLYVSIICSALTIIGCIPAQTVKKNCWDVAAERCLPCIQAGYECEIWWGSLKNTPVHAEACVIINGERVWLRDVGIYSILLDPDYTPPGFTPIFQFSFREWIKLMYFE